jgi:DNA-binding NtrC family response regulator
VATVLIVDDDPNVIAILRSFLIEEGFTVRTARDGVEALDRLMRAPVAFVISDVRMPAVDGRTLVQEMRRRGDRSPVLLISGYEHLVDVEPNTRFLRKPFDLDQLLDVISWASTASEPTAYQNLV